MQAVMETAAAAAAVIEARSPLSRREGEGGDGRRKAEGGQSGVAESGCQAAALGANQGA